MTSKQRVIYISSQSHFPDNFQISLNDALHKTDIIDDITAINLNFIYNVGGFIVILKKHFIHTQVGGT